MVVRSNTLKAYLFPIVLVLSVILGGLTGYLGGQNISFLKPLADIFLNLIFTAIVPLIFFSISSAIARVGSGTQLGRIFGSMSLVFLGTGFVAAFYSLLVVLCFPPAQGVHLQLTQSSQSSPLAFSSQIVAIFTVSDFSKLWSHEHILALILFSILVGLAVSYSKEKGAVFYTFLSSGEEVFSRVFTLIMYYAPIGFFAYFAVLVADMGPRLMGSYLRVGGLYYMSALIYFFVAYTAYAFWVGKSQGVRLFWSNILLPVVTSLGTCSSAASIPANLAAAKKMNIAPEIYDTVIPIGTLIHKEGSIIGGVFKIAFLFGVLQLPFSDASVLLTAVGVSLLVGTVMGAIPSGGMLGELLILTVYGFPPSALILIAAISIIIDPLATMINVVGNSISSILVAALVGSKSVLEGVNKQLIE